MKEIVFLGLHAAIGLHAQSTLDLNAQRIEGAIRAGSLERLIDHLSAQFAGTA